MNDKAMDRKVQNLFKDVVNNLGISDVNHHHHHHFVGNISPSVPYPRQVYFPGPGNNFRGNTGPYYQSSFSVPGGNYPGGNYPSGNYPGGNYPGGNYPGGNYPGGNYPGGAPYRPYPPFTPDFNRVTPGNLQGRSGAHYGPGPHGPGLCSALCGYGWFPPAHCVGNFSWCEGRHGSIPFNAVQVGIDKDGGSIYAGRAFYEGDLLPAKVIPSHRCAFVPWGGKEHIIHEYEVLCSVHVGWTTCSRGDIPPEAIAVGQTANGERLYMGRVMHDGTLTPGKIQPSHGVLYIPYAGMELTYTEYEAMVLM